MSAIRIADFDTWRSGYGLATVTVLVAGTSVSATIYTNVALTGSPAPNPQTLIEKTDGGISYGKFQVPLYIGEPYQLQINSVDETGIVYPPVTTLDQQDASDTTVVATGANQTIALDDYMARSIDVRNYGAFVAVESGASATTNNTTIVAAIAVANAQGGGFVELPGGTFQFTDFTLPLGVILRGVGREGTVLQSTIASKVVTISGQRAGFTRLTLDGISQVANSIGVFAEVIDQIVFDDVEVKRFATGIQQKGGQHSDWRDLYLSDCLIGYQGHGDSDSGNGGPLQFNRWVGGRVELCATAGIELKNIDELCQHNTFSGLAINDNTGTAVHVLGARATKFEDCNCSANTTDLAIDDGTPLNANADNTVVGFEWNGGSFSGTSAGSPGAINLSDTLESVAFRRVELSNEVITITTPGHNVLAQDCREITGVSIVGNTPTAWVVSKTYDRGNSSGLTTGTVATKAWGLELAAGERVFLEAKVVARARNNTNSAWLHFVVGAMRPGAALAYDTQTANYTAGNVLTGQTSRATARIVADSDSGTFGTLTLHDVVGTFVDNEIITDTGSGSANVNGSITLSVVAVTSPTALFTSHTDAAWVAAFAANGSEVQLNVTGDTSMTIEWTVDVDVVRCG
jgi:hypothetical protein